MHSLVKVIPYILVLAALSACATTPARPAVSTIRFTAPLPRIEPGRADSKNPVSLALFAEGLCRKGKYVEAGDYFVKASRFESRGDAFRKDMLRSAALVYFRSGDRDRFAETMEGLFSVLSEYEIADPDPQTGFLIRCYIRHTGKSLPRKGNSFLRKED